MSECLRSYTKKFLEIKKIVSKLTKGEHFVIGFKFENDCQTF